VSRFVRDMALAAPTLVSRFMAVARRSTGKTGDSGAASNSEAPASFFSANAGQGSGQGEIEVSSSFLAPPMAPRPAPRPRRRTLRARFRSRFFARIFKPRGS